MFKFVAVGLFSVGLFGVLAQPHLVRKILALNLASVGVFLFMISTAERGAAPADPVPHAMVITGIVVSVSSTAFALTLVSRVYRSTRRIHLNWWPSRPRQNKPGRDPWK